MDAMGGPSRQLRLSKFDSQGVTTTWKNEEEKAAAEAQISKLEKAFSTIIECLGDPDPTREGLRKTPHRAAKALLFFTKGYEDDLKSKASPLWLVSH